MLQLAVQDAGRLAVLTLKGDLKRDQADELKAHLRRSLDYVGRIIINCEKVTGVDTICLHILCSAYRLSQTLHKEFSLAGHRPEIFRQAVKVSEYSHCVGCGLECDHGCIWGMA